MLLGGKLEPRSLLEVPCKEGVCSVRASAPPGNGNLTDSLCPSRTSAADKVWKNWSSQSFYWRLLELRQGACGPQLFLGREKGLSYVTGCPIQLFSFSPTPGNSA